MTERDARESQCFPEAESGQLTAETAQSVCTIFTPVEQPRRFHPMGEGKSDGGASVHVDILAGEHTAEDGAAIPESRKGVTKFRYAWLRRAFREGGQSPACALRIARTSAIACGF